MARPKKPPTITVTVTYPSRKRSWYCMHSGQVDKEGRPLWKRPGHLLKDGDHLRHCHLTSAHGWKCYVQLCQDHWPDHEYEHTLAKLGGE